MHWRSRKGLSRWPADIERFLGQAGLDRGPWLAVGFAAGIVGWFALANAWQWAALACGGLGVAAATTVLARPGGRWPFLTQAAAWMGVALAAG